MLVTHDQDEALSLRDQVAVVRAGRLVQTGTPEQLYLAPRDTGVAQFVGAAVLLPAVVNGSVASCALGELRVGDGSPQGPHQVLVRPEQIEIGSTGVPARVCDVIYYGHDATVRLQLGDGPRVLARVLGTQVPEREADVRVGVHGQVLVFPAG